MESFIKFPELRWSDIDPNTHLRHSVYYDFAASCRVSFLLENGLSPQLMQELHIGPILFREEAKFKREIILGDQLSIDLQLVRTRKDISRWTIRHQLIKNQDTLAAIITVDGAWLDTLQRKLAIPPALIVDIFTAIPRSADFEWEGAGA